MTIYKKSNEEIEFMKKSFHRIKKKRKKKNEAI